MRLALIYAGLSALFLQVSCLSHRPSSSEALNICGSNDLQEVSLADFAPLWPRTFIDQHEKAVIALRQHPTPTPYCSGFLFSEDLVLTAHHCVDWRKASDLRVMFAYQMAADGRTQLKPQEFAVERILETGFEGRDYAILKLSPDSRKHLLASNFRPLRLSQGETDEGSPLLMIQHPAGQPKKAAAGHLTARDKERLLYNDIDTQASSSGSPVLNQKGEVVAIHTNGGCTTSGGSNKGLSLVSLQSISPTLNSQLLPPLRDSLPSPIPDHSSLGIRLQKSVRGRGPVESVRVKVNLVHGIPADLMLRLRSPSGNMVTLRDRGVDGQLGENEFIYPDKRAPLDSFDLLRGEMSEGTWELWIADRTFGTRGKITSWELEINPAP